METVCLAVCVHVLLHWNPQSTACMDLSQHRGNHTECIHKSHHAIILGLRLEFHLSVSFCKCSDVNQQAYKQKLLRRRFYSGHIAVTHNQLEKNTLGIPSHAPPLSPSQVSEWSVGTENPCAFSRAFINLSECHSVLYSIQSNENALPRRLIHSSLCICQTHGNNFKSSIFFSVEGNKLINGRLKQSVRRTMLDRGNNCSHH